MLNSFISLSMLNPLFISTTYILCSWPRSHIIQSNRGYILQNKHFMLKPFRKIFNVEKKIEILSLTIFLIRVVEITNNTMDLYTLLGYSLSKCNHKCLYMFCEYFFHSAKITHPPDRCERHTHSHFHSLCRVQPDP